MMAAVVEEMSDAQKNVFEKITDNDVLAVKSLISQPDFNVDYVDENGMTPLQHACYKGNKEIVQVLLDHGADVNSSRHQHNYSALHFAALSGNEELCMLLLLHGARSHALNSVNRTPSQMAAFVGNHGCVSAINNFIPKSDVEYYTVPRGLDTEPKLEQFLASSFHKFIMQVNIHPIHVLMYLRHVPQLVEHQQQVCKVLGLMSEREMKRGAEANEVLAFKFHWLNSVLIELTMLTEAEKEKEKDLVECCIKRLIRPSMQDQFVRLSVRRFPFTECTIFRQLVSTITGYAKEGCAPGSLMSAVNAAINGQRGFAADSQCSTCGEEKASRRCSRCKSEIYCGSECQKIHWPIHKKSCSPANSSTSSAAVSEAMAQSIAQSLQVQ